MNILVTGGSGLVGGFVVDELLQAGHRVAVLDRVPPQQRAGTLQDTRFIRADILRLGDLTWAFEGQEAIIHLAAIPHPLKRLCSFSSSPGSDAELRCGFSSAMIVAYRRATTAVHNNSFLNPNWSLGRR